MKNATNVVNQDMRKRYKNQDPQDDINIVEHRSKEELLLTISCDTTNKFTKGLIIYSGCINHMTHD